MSRLMRAVSSGSALFAIRLLLVALAATSEAAATSCTTAVVSPTDPPLPKLQDSYQVDVQCNIIDRGYTMQASIYFDYDGNRAAMTYLTRSFTGSLIYSYNTDEIFMVQGSECVVKNLTISTQFEILFGETHSHGIPHIMHAQTAFKFDSEMGEVFMGNATLAGIPVHHWRNCGTYNNATFTLDYYFSYNWTTASTYSSVPVRAEVWAVQMVNGTAHPMHHIYNYYNMRIIDPPASVFQTPQGMFCPGRKNVRTLPKLPTQFHFKAEIITTMKSSISYLDLWYDELHNLMRIDYRPVGDPLSPDSATNPRTEIHDFNTGLRYVIDKSLSNCTVMTLYKNGVDVGMNGSAVMYLKNPVQLFRLNWNYTYQGQFYVRDVLCDVFVSEQPDFAFGQNRTSNITVTVYFLAYGWNVYAEDGTAANSLATPMKLELKSPEFEPIIYHFLDFDVDPPPLSVFDIKPCFSESYQLKFQVQFPGKYIATSGPSLLQLARHTFAQTMHVSPLRLQEGTIDYDDASVYITTTLLDRPPTLARFHYTGHVATNHAANRTIYPNVNSTAACSSICVDYQGFPCNSFDLCPTTSSCLLYADHVSAASPVVPNGPCMHYSRNVDALPAEPSINDAYQAIRNSSLSKTLRLVYKQKVYTAVNIKVIFGWMQSNVKLPPINDHVSYTVELSMPFIENVYTAKVWYDKTSRLTRMDMHYNRLMYPYYTTDPVSIVTDYSDGIQYIMDKTHQNCTVQRMPADDFITKLSNNTAANATWFVMMKSPRELFYIDDSYNFVGQQTVRGMLCNVFQSVRTDFVVPQYNKVTSIFRYAFLASAWTETGELSDSVRSQPIQLEVTIIEVGYNMQYNMFDYSTDPIDLSVFDIHQCYDYTQEQHFQLSFPGPYSQYLNMTSNVFLSVAVSKLAAVTRVSMLRFQRPQLDYDNQNVYLTSTLVGLPDYSMFFTHIVNGSTVEQAGMVLANDTTAVECGNTCFGYTAFTCNSYYFSPDGQCLLSQKHVPDSKSSHADATFQAYSRTVTPGTGAPPPTLLIAYLTLKNNVYMGRIKFNVPTLATANATHQFIASSIRSDIVGPAGRMDKYKAMQHFTMLIEGMSLTSEYYKQLQGVSMDDCAQACITDISMNCQGFSYGETAALECALTTSHPGQLKPASKTPNIRWSIFARNYIDAYTKSPGSMYRVSANGQKASVSSANDCAKFCAQGTSNACRAFAYCRTDQTCLIYNDRAVGDRQPNTVTTCDLYSSSYMMDFKAVNSGVFTFHNVIKVINVAVCDCANMCVAEQGSACRGFYFSGKSGTCWLTVATAGSAQVKMSTNDSADFFDAYQRQYFPPSATVATGAVTSATEPPVNTGATGVTGPKTTLLGTGITGPQTKRPGTGATGPQTTQSGTGNQGSTLRSQQVIYKTKTDKGVVVGVAFAMLIVGLIGGAVGFYFFKRFRKTSDYNDMKANFSTHEDM